MVVYENFFHIVKIFCSTQDLKIFSKTSVTKVFADQSQFSELRTNVNEDIRHIRQTHFRKQIQCQIKIRIKPHHAELFLL